MGDPHAGPDPLQVRTLAHVKRFTEAFVGDPEFRRSAKTPSARERLLAEVGIDLSAADLAPFWRLADNENPPDEAEFRAHALGTLWLDWIQGQRECLGRHASAWAPAGSARFIAWRKRQIARAESEALVRSDLNVFPLFAFELSKGCSVRCWFCAWNPPRLEGYVPYTPGNRQLWREILDAAGDLFGPGCRAAACYHATEPTDNPDYFRFLEDFHDICGIYPQTTTACPLKNIGWTRELLRLRERCASSRDRFSVLSLGALRAIHRTFSAEDLASVRLVLQNAGALAEKVPCGRALDHPGRLLAAERVARGYAPAATGVPPLTIECTCGYLVNLVDRNVRLISPCRATDRSPMGYTVHAEGTFRDGAEFRAFIGRSIDEYMPEHLARHDTVAFRDDLAYEVLEHGFTLTSRHGRHTLEGGPHAALLGDLVHRGDQSTGEIIERLIRAGTPVFETVSLLDRLYQRGLIAEAPGASAPERRRGAETAGLV
jgi:radical SAM family RiPP maturation amino acid epimerase